MKNKGQKCCITIDKWTSKGNRRYLHNSLHQLEYDFNLGLSSILSTCDAKKMLKLVSEKLKAFSLNLSTDIVVSTNNSAVVMKQLTTYPQRLIIIYSYAIHLALAD